MDLRRFKHRYILTTGDTIFDTSSVLVSLKSITE